MENDQEKVLRFVTTDKSSEKNLFRASEACKKYELDVEWICADELTNQDLKVQRSVFVLERFEGEVFEFLRENCCRIVGPQCVLSCLQTQTPLPINVEHAVYSVAMRGMVVTCTSVPRQERDRLSELIQFMGGTVLKDLTSSVTHLVAGEVGSKKYRYACNLNLPVLLPDWVYTCWDLCRDRHICATDEEFMKYKCPIFKGITLCVTGIEADKRKEIKQHVALHGGTYSGELNMNTCTHLLVDMPRGEKYEYARRWNLHCVSTQWFYDSIQFGICLDEVDYYMLPADENNSSTAGRQISGNFVKVSSASKTSAEKKISSKAAQAALKSAQKHGNKDLMGTSGSKRSLPNQSKRFDNVSRLGETHLSDGDGADFDIRMQPGNLFLDGCKIYLSGFSGEKLEKLRKIINCGGGTRFNQINEIVSHVVIGDKVDEDLEFLCSWEFQGFVVGVQWILNSAREGMKLAEEEYLCSDLIQPQDVSPSCKENKDPAVRPSKPPTSVPPPLEKLPGEKKDITGAKQEEDFFEDDDDDDVFQQYMPQDVDNNIKSAENPPLADNRDQVKDLHEPSADPDATLDEDDAPGQDESALLSGRHFTVAGFADEHVERLRQLIEGNGGQYVCDGQTADYAIIPMNMVPDSNSRQAKQFATFCWLEQSIECGQLLELNDSFLFKPFSIPRGDKPLTGCVLSISQYTGMERDHMYQLAELLGASCQEYFVRKASRNYQASTHLLCQDFDGKKYQAAVKWNIPVVSREWLFACAETGTLVPIDDHPVVEVNANGKSMSVTCPSDDLSNEKINPSREDAMTENARAVQEVAMETSSTTAAQSVSSNKVECQSAVNTDQIPGDIGSTKKHPTNRPSIYNHLFRPSFDLADVMDELASPVCPSIRGKKSRASRNSFPLDDFFAENIKQTLQKLGTVALPTKDGESGHHDGDETTNEQEQKEMAASPKQGILAGIILSVSKKLSQRQTELFTLASLLGADYRWLYDESCTHLIHQGSNNDKSKEYTQARDRGIHVVSPHWLYTCQEMNERVDESMYPHTFNPKLSLPVVTTGRRVTRSSKAAPLEPELSPDKKGKAAVAKKTEPKNSEKPFKTGNGSVEESNVVPEGEQGAAAEEIAEMGAATLESLEAREDFKRQLEAIMDATKGKGRRRSRRNTSSNNSSSASHNASGSVTSADVSLATRRTSSRLRLRSKDTDGAGNKSSSRVKSRFPATDESEHSQSDTITYDDPAGRMEREKIMAQLKRGASPSPDCNTEEDEEYRRSSTTHKNGQDTDTKDSSVTETRVPFNNNNNNNNNNNTVDRHVRQLSTTIRSEPPSPISSSTPAAPPLGLQIKDTLKPEPVNLLDGTMLDQTQTRGPTTPKFHLSVMTPQEKIDYSALIEQLGGQVFDTVYFNPECTHVVVGKPNRNEKYLAAVAAGKWVLHKSYLEASREAGFFVDEASHEWGQEVPGETLNKLAAAAQRWRLKLIQERAKSTVNGPAAQVCGAFSGWVVLLCVDKSRQPGFKRLLESGGAKVSASRPPFRNTREFTHAFLDVSKTKLEVSDLSLLQKDGVWCLKPDYIAEFLMQDPPPRPEKYQVPEPTASAEPNKPVSSQSKKRKGDHDVSVSDKRPRV